MMNICYNEWTSINTLLLAKSHTFLNNLDFYLYLCFICPKSHSGLHLVILSSYALLGYGIFLGCPCFWWFDIFCRMSLNLNLSHVFLMIKKGYMVLERRPQGRNAIFIISYKRYILSTWHHCWYFDLGAEVVSVRFLHCPVTLSLLFILLFLEESHYM